MKTFLEGLSTEVLSENDYWAEAPTLSRSDIDIDIMPTWNTGGAIATRLLGEVTNDYAIEGRWSGL